MLCLVHVNSLYCFEIKHITLNRYNVLDEIVLMENAVTVIL